MENADSQLERDASLGSYQVSMLQNLFSFMVDVPANGTAHLYVVQK
jgi:hypothetical protein